ncbi:MAG: hypothetical protein SNH13_04685 [Rikenellaceae bacterium]
MVANYIRSVITYLNKNVRYAVLRNYEGLPHNNSSRDIDIIIDRGEFNRVRWGLAATLLQDDWQLFSWLDNGRLITYVCAKMREDGGVEMVQWDLFTSTSIHGVVLASANEMLASRAYNGVLYHVSKEWEFLDKYLYNRAVGDAYPAKYQQTRDMVSVSDVVRAKIADIFGCDGLHECDRLSGQKLFRRALWRNFRRSPLSTLTSVISSRVLYLWLFLTSRTSPCISFTGADGVGKTTVIDTLRQQIAGVYGEATEYFHFRPLLIPNIGDVAESAGVMRGVDRDYASPHRSKRKGVVSSLLRLCYYTLDYVVGYWVEVKPHRKLTKVIIFDRYFSDVVVDSRRSSIYLNTKFLYLWSRLFIPRFRYNFLITATPTTIRQRKQELESEQIESINAKMDYLATKKGYYLIHNNGVVEVCVAEIMAIIITEQHKYNIGHI